MKFSIRDLMWLTVVAALAVGWWVDHRRLAESKRISDEEKREVERQLRIATFDPAKW